MKKHLIWMILLQISSVVYAQNKYTVLDPEYYKDTLILKSGEIFVCNIREDKRKVYSANPLHCEYLTAEGKSALKQVSKSTIDEIIYWRYDKTFLNQYIDKNETNLTYRGVITVDNASSGEIFAQARKWFFELFKDSGEVLEISDKETGELAGKAVLTGGYRNMGQYVFHDITYDVIIDVKEGKYRFTLTDFKGAGVIFTQDNKCPANQLNGRRQKGMDKAWQYLKVDIEEEASTIITSLLIHMNQTKNDEW